MRSFVKELAKRLAGMLFGDYSVYRIYSRLPDAPSASPPVTTASLTVAPVDEAAINSSGDSLIRDQAGYMGPGSHGYACFDGDRIVGVCFYWFGERYLKRNFWPLADGEAKLVQIISLPEVRGRGVASLLIAVSCQDMMQKGFHRAYARIWHSNTPSLRAFERSGWTRRALVIEAHPGWRRRPIRMSFDAKPSTRKT